MNLRPSGYEPDELPGCSTPHQLSARRTEPGTFAMGGSRRQAKRRLPQRQAAIASEANAPNVRVCRVVKAAEVAEPEEDRDNSNGTADEREIVGAARFEANGPGLRALGVG